MEPDSRRVVRLGLGGLFLGGEEIFLVGLGEFLLGGQSTLFPRPPWEGSRPVNKAPQAPLSSVLTI